MDELFFFYSILVTLSTFMTINSLNPIHAMFWLVLLFMFSSWLLMLLNLEFFPLILVMIYMGAMTMLFLFVVMMLNIVELKKVDSINNSIPLMIMTISLFLLKFLFSKEMGMNFISFSNEFLMNFNWKSQIQMISSIIYMDYYFPIIYISILLLMAMMGAMVLSLELKKNSKNQVLYNQHKSLIN